MILKINKSDYLYHNKNGIANREVNRPNVTVNEPAVFLIINTHNDMVFIYFNL